jgi:hypothetical protein
MMKLFWSMVAALGAELAQRLFALQVRTGAVSLVTYYSDVQTVINGPQSGLAPATRVKANKHGGRLRFMEAFFVVPAATLLVGDKLYWFKLPLKSRLVGHLSKLIFTAGTASSTANLGDNVVPARHLAATAINAAGSAVPIVSEQVNTGTATTVASSNIATIASSPGSFQVGSLITGTGIAANTVIAAISGSGIGALVQLSNNATASGTNTMTMTGGGYEVTDDSNSVANAFSSTTDDATLVSTIAGAAAPAGQVLTLKAAYVQD